MTDIVIPQPRNKVSQATTVEQSRAVAEVQAAVFVAQQFPRDIQRAIGEMKDSCGRKALADRAFYQVTNRGTGPSIHLAKELARIWGNIDYGVRELARDDTAGESEMLAFAWDQQTNSRQSRTFISPHQRMKKVNGVQTRQPLTDLTDVYLMNQNTGARALRECIMTLLPTWFTEEAQTICRKTIEFGDGVPLPTRIEQAVSAFAAGGVKPGQLETRLGKKRGQWDAGDVATLQVLFTSINRGETTAADEFPAEAPTVASITGGAATEGARAEADRIADETAPPNVNTQTGEVTGPDPDIPDPEPVREPLTGSQRDKMFAAFAQAGVTLGDRNTAANKEHRLAYVRQVIGREVASVNDLSKREAGVVIEMLEKDVAELREQPPADGAFFEGGEPS